MTCKADTGNQASWSANLLIQSANQLIGTHPLLANGIPVHQSACWPCSPWPVITCQDCFQWSRATSERLAKCDVPPAAFLLLTWSYDKDTTARVHTHTCTYTDTRSFALGYQTSVNWKSCAELADSNCGCICAHQEVKGKVTSSLCVCVCAHMWAFSTLSNFPEVWWSLPLLRAPVDEFLLWVWSPGAIRWVYGKR